MHKKPVELIIYYIIIKKDYKIEVEKLNMKKRNQNAARIQRWLHFMLQRKQFSTIDITNMQNYSIIEGMDHANGWDTNAPANFHDVNAIML